MTSPKVSPTISSASSSASCLFKASTSSLMLLKIRLQLRRLQVRRLQLRRLQLKLQLNKPTTTSSI